VDPTRILIMDWDPGFRQELAEALTARGYRPAAFGAAVQGVASAEKTDYGCAVVGLVLNDMSGFEAIPLLRETDPGLPIIAVADENTRELEAKVRRQDVVYYYVKTFDRPELLEAVDRAAGRCGPSGKRKILVVDDDADYQAAVKQILESAGYEVLAAYGKDEGLAALNEHSPDLIILDIMMTKSTDGFFFLYEMKAKAEGKKPPVLSVSVISRETGMKFSPTEDGDYFPADDFLSKPVDPAELLEHVEALLAGRRTQRPNE